MTSLEDIIEARIRRKAYGLWQEAGSPEGRAEDFWFAAQAAIQADEDHYDEELEESFPASDPPVHP